MYKSQNKEALNNFKEFLKDNVEDDQAQYGWSFFYKHLFVDDLNKYVRLKSNNAVIEVGYGDFNSSVAFVLNSMTDSKYIGFLRPLLDKLNMDFNNIYFTSYTKTNVFNKELFDEAIGLELKCIAPQIVFTIGDYGIQENGFEVVIVDKENMDKMLELSAKEGINEAETQELIERKKVLWQQIKLIIKYYSN